MHVLLIAYYYPPVCGGGTMRPLMMARHLPRFGHRVTVVTHTYGPDVLTGEVIRVHDPSFNRQRTGARKIQWALRRAHTELLNRAGIYHSIYGRWLSRSRRILDAALGSLRPDVVLATYSPVESLELGLHVAPRAGVPLIADFRDGLLFEPIEDSRMRAHRCIRDTYADIERSTVEHSAALITALPRVKTYFEEEYGASTVSAIPNACDPGDFDDLPAIEFEPRTFNMVHTGSFALSDATCDIGPFVTALRRLSSEESDLAGRLRLHQLGRLSRGERESLADLIDHGMVLDHGEAQRPTCLAYQRRADLLLLITSTRRPSVAPGKTFEYLCAGRPILGLCAGTFAAEILSDTGAGPFIDPTDDRVIFDRLVSAIHGANQADADESRIAAYSLDNRMAELDEVLRSSVI